MHGGMMHEMHEMHSGMIHGMHEMQMEEHEREEHVESAERRAGNWTYFSGRLEASAAESTPSAKPGKKATHAYTNDDVNRQNEKNGSVKYDGKTEKI
jgi:hypothetical protein